MQKKVYCFLSILKKCNVKFAQTGSPRRDLFLKLPPPFIHTENAIVIVLEI